MDENGSVSLLTLELHLPGCKSLKQKRGMLQPMLTRLHREFNISASEVARLDIWDESILSCALVSNDGKHNQRVLSEVVNYFASHFPEIEILSHSIESR